MTSSRDLFTMAREYTPRQQLLNTFRESDFRQDLEQYYDYDEITPELIRELEQELSRTEIECDYSPDSTGLTCAWETASACWSGLANILIYMREPGVTDFDSALKFSHNKITVITQNELPSSDGIYYVEWSGFENHYFAFQIKQQRLMYAGSYGGACLLKFKEFDRDTWLNLLGNAMAGSIKAYAQAFLIQDKVNPYFKTTEFKEMTISRH